MERAIGKGKLALGWRFNLRLLLLGVMEFFKLASSLGVDIIGGGIQMISLTSDDIPN